MTIKLGRLTRSTTTTVPTTADGPAARPVGSLIGRYRVQKHLGSGGMADVYLVRAPGEARELALKRLRARHADDPMFRQMLMDEARLMRHLSHPNIVRVDDVSCAADGYFTMEYVAGVPLNRLVQRAHAAFRGLPVNIGVAITCCVASGLDYAHDSCDEQGTALGVVHRDVSLANVLVGFDGSVKLVDFGVARSRSREQETGVNLVKGKMGYMSPEQILGLELDRRSDVFTLGIVLYELLTGTRLFRYSSDYECLHRIVREPVVPPSRVAPRVPAELDAIVMRALEKDPGDRYQRTSDMLLALASFAETDITTDANTIGRFVRGLFVADQPDVEHDSDIPEQAGLDQPDLPSESLEADTDICDIASCFASPRDPASNVHSTGPSRGRAPDRETDVTRLRRSAERYLAAGQYAAAIGAFEFLLSSVPADTLARAGYYEATGRQAEADGRHGTATQYLRWASELRGRSEGGRPAARMRAHSRPPSTCDGRLPVCVELMGGSGSV